jgi:hypothetical protein
MAEFKRSFAVRRRSGRAATSVAQRAFVAAPHRRGIRARLVPRQRELNRRSARSRASPGRAARSAPVSTLPPAWTRRYAIRVAAGLTVAVAHSRLPEDYTARLRSQRDRLPSRCDRRCRRRTCPFTARLAATRNAPSPRRRSDAAR